MNDNPVQLAWENEILNLINSSYKEKRQGISYNYYSFIWHLGSLNYDLSFIDKVYPGKEAKKSYLMKAYFNEDSLKRAKERLRGKKNTSVNISLINKDKTNTKQDHCMVSMVLFKDNKKYKATVFYRTTEVCRKFLFDLKFLKEEILTYLDIPDCDLTFMFAKLTISYAFLHTLFLIGKYYPESLKICDLSEEFWRGYLQYINKMVNLKERGTALKSHWRHFQTFKKTKTFKLIYSFLENQYAGTD